MATIPTRNLKQISKSRKIPRKTDQKIPSKVTMMEFAFSKIIMNSTLGFSVTFRNIAFKKNLMTTSSESVCLVVSTRFSRT